MLQRQTSDLQGPCAIGSLPLPASIPHGHACHRPSASSDISNTIAVNKVMHCKGLAPEYLFLHNELRQTPKLSSLLVVCARHPSSAVRGLLGDQIATTEVLWMQRELLQPGLVAVVPYRIYLPSHRILIQTNPSFASSRQISRRTISDGAVPLLQDSSFTS